VNCYPAPVHGIGQGGLSADLFQQEIMSSIQARLGLGVFDFTRVEALAKACLYQQSLAVGQVQALCAECFPLEEIYLDGLVPAARLLGEWWSSDQIDFTEVTFGIRCLQQILYEFSPQFMRQTDCKNNGYRAIFFTTPQSQHSFGIVLLAEFFRRDGREVSNVVIKSDSDVISEMSRQWFDIAGFSVCSDRGIAQLKQLILDARMASANPRTQFMLGGPMAELNPGLLVTLGADLLGGDARDSQRLAFQQVKKLQSANETPLPERNLGPMTSTQFDAPT